MKSQFCDTLLYNGKVITVDENFSIAEAIAIGGGRFLKVGRNKEVHALAGPDTNKLDLKGRMVTPGFIDTHPHPFSLSLGYTTWAQLTGLHSIEAIKKPIAEWAKRTPPGEWILTSPVGDQPYFFNVPDILQEKRWPTRWDLDKVSPNNPVYITPPICRVPNTAILNSLGLKRFGITKDTPSEGPGGVEIVRDPETGEPNGQLHGMQRIYNFSPMYQKLIQQIPTPTFEVSLNNLRAWLKEMNAAGVTTCYETHNVFPEQLLFYMNLWLKGELTMRTVFVYELDRTKSLEEIENWMKNLVHATGSGFGDDLLKTCGICVSIDGPIFHGAAAMNEPYLDPHGKKTTGKMLYTQEKFREIALLAAKYNLRLNSCFGGNKAGDITLQVFDEVNRKIPIKGRRWVIQHIQFPSLENIQKCKELELSVTTSTNFEWGKGAECYIPRLGKEMAAEAAPLRQWLDAGVPIAQSSDYGPYNPLFTLWQSLKRIHGLTGESLAGPDQKISREEALRIYTLNGARVLFWEDKLGSIEAGKLADLVVLDNDILTCPLDEIKDTKVLMTMLGGKVIHGGL